MTRLSGEQVSLEVPDGWDARIFRRDAEGPETTHAVVHLANFGLPQDTADYGDGAVQLMRTDHVLICLVEFHPTSRAEALFASLGLPVTLSGRDATKSTLQRAIGGQAGIQRFFSLAGRAWCLYVVLGSYDRRHRLVGLVNRALTAVTIHPLALGDAP